MTPTEEYEAEVERKNFTRAAELATEEGLDEELVSSAREQAFKQALGEWFNFRSAEAMARQWGYGREDISRLCNEIVTTFKEREEQSGRGVKVFDIDRMDHTPVIKLVSQFRDRFR
jgi:hypothetical protein